MVTICPLYGVSKKKTLSQRKNLPIECAQGDQPLRCPNRVFCLNEPSAVPWRRPCTPFIICQVAPRNLVHLKAMAEAFFTSQDSCLAQPDPPFRSKHVRPETTIRLTDILSKNSTGKKNHIYKINFWKRHWKTIAKIALLRAIPTMTCQLQSSGMPENPIEGAAGRGYNGDPARRLCAGGAPAATLVFSPQVRLSPLSLPFDRGHARSYTGEPLSNEAWRVVKVGQNWRLDCNKSRHCATALLPGRRRREAVILCGWAPFHAEEALCENTSWRMPSRRDGKLLGDFFILHGRPVNPRICHQDGAQPFWVSFLYLESQLTRRRAHGNFCTTEHLRVTDDWLLSQLHPFCQGLSTRWPASFEVLPRSLTAKAPENRRLTPKQETSSSSSHPFPGATADGRNLAPPGMALKGIFSTSAGARRISEPSRRAWAMVRSCRFCTWTHWGLSPGPSACGADVIPLHHVPL